ncbi:MAG: benzoate/H(+) symporter BenE family transporter [Anaerolineae bacterium]|jgi:benzoate membrane transport protein|nr:benzoate/H(+) symporter BenE family transporter [Anaerolineae bacterium]
MNQPALHRPPQPAFWRNLRDLPQALSLSAVVAGFLVVLVGYTGPLLILLQAARAGGLTDAQTASWLWAATVGNGITTMLLSLRYRQPLTAPWSTAGVALLVTSLAQYTLPQAVGAYLLCALAVMLLGASGLFGRVMALIPQPVVQGMLAGILLRFGIGLFTTLPERPLMVIAMIGVFFGLKRLQFRAPTLGALIIGVVLAAAGGEIHLDQVALTLTVPQITLPEFTPDAALSLALPLVLLALSSQYAPGQAVLLAAGYRAPINGILVITGGASLVWGLFGGHGVTLGALLAALVTGPDAHPDPDRRYAAAWASGAWYVLFGLFGATVMSLFAGFPAALVAAVAGLALSGTITGALTGALAVPEGREGATVAFLCAAANFTLLGIGAPFWGLVAGIAVHLLLRYGRPAAPAAVKDDAA